MTQTRTQEDYGYKFEFINMSERIRVNFKNFRDKDVDRFALQKVLKGSAVSYEYLNGGVWNNKIDSQKPDETRAVFDDIQVFKAARSAYFMWKDLQSISPCEKPSLPEIIVDRVRSAVLRQDPLVLFVPWGCRYNGKFGNKEKKAMNRIDLSLTAFSNRGVPARVLIMPADVYAKEINGLDNEGVDNYFCNVDSEAVNRGYDVLPWSDIRDSEMDEYLKRREYYSKAQIEQILPPYVIDSAIKAAGKRSNQTSIEEAAIEYLRERLCEAEIIEGRFKPIKLSMVSKNKDNDVDISLPRLYLLPENLQFPWL